MHINKIVQFIKCILSCGLFVLTGLFPCKIIYLIDLTSARFASTILHTWPQKSLRKIYVHTYIHMYKLKICLSIYNKIFALFYNVFSCALSFSRDRTIKPLSTPAHCWKTPAPIPIDSIIHHIRGLIVCRFGLTAAAIKPCLTAMYKTFNSFTLQYKWKKIPWI